MTTLIQRTEYRLRGTRISAFRGYELNVKEFDVSTDRIELGAEMKDTLHIPHETTLKITVIVELEVDEE